VFRKAGPKALADLIAAARPAVDFLFERERDRAPLSTPEEKSSFRKRLREAAQRIADPETQRLYREELNARADTLLARPSPPPRGAQRRPGERWQPPIAVRAETKAIAAPGQRALRVEALLREAIDSPSLIEGHTELLARLPLEDPSLDFIRDQAIHLFIEGEPVDRTRLSLHLSNLGEVRAVARLSHWPAPHQGVRHAKDPKDVEAEWVVAAEREVAELALKDEIDALRGADLDANDEAFARAVKMIEDGKQADRRRSDAKDDDAA
jgi:DNA primase